MQIQAVTAGAPVVLLGFFSVLSAAEPPATIHFDTDIRPLLSDRCYRCHGPDRETRQADLRLDLEEAAKEHAVIPGKPAASELYARIASTDADMRMPPADSNLTLTADEIERIRRWIEQGAPWSTHWAFVPPKRTPIPTVNSRTWPKNEIDRFVLHTLERAGLKPAPEADRATLIRRLSFDLTGLPPSLKEIDAFLNDRSANAYETVVDRLLSSERYGERMAASWLDAARYSDTYGYQVDRDRYVWPWRDWVVGAFNKNRHYDQFLTEQLAGDLLPNATDDQILATTFNRLHSQKVEGGSVPEEFRVEYVADRTQTFATAILGLTMQCCRCHDHKFDPITQKEYYQLSAFFDNIDEAGLYSYFTKSVPTPTLLLADAETKKQLANAERRIADAEHAVASLATARRGAFDNWLRDVHQSNANAGKEKGRAVGLPLEMPGCIAHLDFEDHKDLANQAVLGRFGKAVKLTGDDGIALKVGNFRRDEPFSISLWINTPNEKERAVVLHRSRAWTDAGSRGYQLLIENGRLSASLIHFWPGNAIRVRTRRRIPTRQWLNVCMTYDGSSRAHGLQIHIDGKPAACDVVRDNLSRKITGGGGDNISIGQRFRDRGFTDGLVDELRVFDRELTALEVASLYDGRSLASSLNAAEQASGKTPHAQLYAYYLATVDAEYRRGLARLQESREECNKLRDTPPEIMVMRELPRPRPTFLLERGAYDAPGERVYPGTPAACPPFPKGQPANRLGLARWLTAPDHPLTARVAVNRFWQICFGDGLVRTPEDFGSQGQPPTHPELLDWLALDFVTHHWDVKRSMKKIVMSATYRQTSTADTALKTRDPENRLLARGPEYRLPAEMLRDNALAVSGLLVPTVGGHPVRPYEVESSFKPVKRDQGAGLYRRSLYTYWKRTAPPPVMMTLDAPKRDVCQVRRERTTSPLQALVLLNGPQFVEAARILAQRLIQQHGTQMEPILDDMFRVLTSRHPSDAERQVLTRLYQNQLKYFDTHLDRARKYLKTGDAVCDPAISPARLAALSVVGNMLLNYDQSMMKR